MERVIISLILTIGISGCAGHRLIEPMCVPARPILQPVSVEEQAEIPPLVLIKVAQNQYKLQQHIITIEEIARIHNEQFEASCP